MVQIMEADRGQGFMMAVHDGRGTMLSAYMQPVLPWALPRAPFMRYMFARMYTGVPRGVHA